LWSTLSIAYGTFETQGLQLGKLAMKRLDYRNRRFVGVVNYDSGDFTIETVFHYRHEHDVVWGTYHGGGVRFGTLIATVGADGSLDMRWQYVNTEGQLKTGMCQSTPEVLSDGRIRLHESWQTTDGPERRGTSVVEELRPTRSSETKT
jgi:hypothetical protein